MKLVQLNIWGGKLEYDIPRFLAAEAPDIVCLQEVHDMPGSSGALFVTLDELSEKCGFRYSSMAPVHSFNYMNRVAKYGNAILAKQPIQDEETVFVQGKYRDNYDETTDADHARNFQHASFSIQGKTLHIINFHGAFIPGSKAGNGATMAHTKMIDSYAKQFGSDPVIITGDFNLETLSPSIRQLNDTFRNLPIENGVTSTYSPVLHTFETVCDYIFVNDTVKVDGFGVSEAIVSDHLALVLEFDI